MTLFELNEVITNAKFGNAGYSGDELYIPVYDMYNELQAIVYLDDSELDQDRSLEFVNIEHLYITDIQIVSFREVTE